jgi:hypothetical protein
LTVKDYDSGYGGSVNSELNGDLPLLVDTDTEVIGSGRLDRFSERLWSDRRFDLRRTVILTDDHRRIIVPNSIMSNEPIINWTIREPEITWTVDFDLSNVPDIDRARDIILQEAKSHPKVPKKTNR